MTDPEPSAAEQAGSEPIVTEPVATESTATESTATEPTTRDASGFDPGNWPDAGDPPAERRRIPIGIIAFSIAALLVVIEVVGIVLANSGQFGIATLIGQGLIVVTALPFLLGLLAIIRGLGRSWGAVAMVVSVLVNPLVLINILALFGGA